MSWFLRCPAWPRQINNICSAVPTWASCSVLLVCLRSANCDPSIWDWTVVWKLFWHFQRSTWSGKNNTKKKQKTDPCSSSQSMLHWLAPAAYRSMSLIKASCFFLYWLSFNGPGFCDVHPGGLFSLGKHGRVCGASNRGGVPPRGHRY